ncbi:MAG: hypothetical protein AAFR75_12160, partial [Pseudomonadota bacterium]
MSEVAKRLAHAYPSVLTVDAHGQLVWRDGTVVDILGPSRVSTSEASVPDWIRSESVWLQSQDLRAIFRDSYQPDQLGAAREKAEPAGDPGRARPARFFKRL